MQTLIKSELTTFLSSLELARRYGEPARAAQIKECLTPGTELCIRIGEHYRKVYPERTGTRREAVRREREFFDKHCHIMVAHEDSRPVGGFVVLGDELLCMHSQRRGSGDWLTQHAVNAGATRLDCFDVPHLVKLYEKYGFRTYRTEFNWEPGGLNVLYMQRGADDD